MVVGSHAIHGCVDDWWPLARTVLGHHPSSRSARLVVACVGAVVIHLAQFRLRRPWSSTMKHPLVIPPVSLVLMVQGGISLLG